MLSGSRWKRRILEQRYRREERSDHPKSALQSSHRMTSHHTSITQSELRKPSGTLDARMGCIRGASVLVPTSAPNISSSNVLLEAEVCFEEFEFEVDEVEAPLPTALLVLTVDGVFVVAVEVSCDGVSSPPLINPNALPPLSLLLD